MEGMVPNHIVLLDDMLDANSEPRELPLQLLRNVTDDFSEERIIGRGGFSVVYKGELEDRIIAVKKLTLRTGSEKEFNREINNLMRVKHENIVRFLGYCNDTESTLVNLANPGEHERHSFEYTKERILCFDYIRNGRLTYYIHDELRGPEWHTRYTIIRGICQGLHYLHDEKKLVHRDLKPDNILLDNFMLPKIADLGISKLLSDGSSNTMTTNASATREYAAPELKDRIVSVKYDIYSLGLIIIELVTGFRQAPDLKMVLTRWRHRWNKSIEALRYEQVAKCIEIGLSCQNQKPKKRPFISEIIKDLDDVDSGNAASQQEIPCWNDLLWVDPPELFFPFQINKQMSCSLELHNEVDAYVAFFIKTNSDMQYKMDHNKGIIQPRSHLSISITLLSQMKAPQKVWNAREFTIKSKKVSVGLTAEEITKEIFSKKCGDIVEKVTICAVFDAQRRAPYMAESSTQSVCDLDKTVIDFTSKEDKKEATGSGTTSTRMEPESMRLAIKTNKKVSLLECHAKLMVELTGGDNTRDRPGLDLVAILDFSSHMHGDKMDQLKSAMRFVIGKLSPIDRLSIVTFSNSARTLCPLREINQASQRELQEVMDGLKAIDVFTNIKAGLIAGIKVLADRKISRGRSVGIILMSSCDQKTKGDATQVNVGNVPVYTFGFGARSDPTVLFAIAAKSMGGTFSHVDDTIDGGLTMAFSQCLAGLLTVVVQDLQLTVATNKGESMLLKLNTGSYPQTQDGSSVTISFGDLYSKEVRKVIVSVLLPRVDTERSAEILKVTYSYSRSSSAGRLQFVAAPEMLTVCRSNLDVSKDKQHPAELEMEDFRLQMVQMIKQLRYTLLYGGWELAYEMKKFRKKLGEAQDMLGHVMEESLFMADVQELLDLLEKSSEQDKDGHFYVLSLESSHNWQRFAARGNIQTMRPFATPRMDKYLEQAKKFHHDSRMPLPSEEDDLMEEVADITVHVASTEEEMPRMPLPWEDDDLTEEVADITVNLPPVQEDDVSSQQPSRGTGYTGRRWVVKGTSWS